MNEMIYHYCSIEVLESILCSKSLRFSELKKSNDKAEIKFFFDVYKEYCEAIQSPLMESMEYLIENAINNTNYVGICFSYSSDSKYMWENYSKQGVAIGFERSSIEEYAKKIMVSPSVVIGDCEVAGGGALSKDVEYKTKEEIIDLFRKQKLIQDINDSRWIIFYRTEGLFIKQKHNNSEKEFRIIVQIPINCNNDAICLTENNNYEMKLFEMKRWDHRGEKDIPYFDVSFDKRLIRSITLSPNCVVSIDQVKSILFKYGFDVSNIQIKQSNL